MNPEKNYTIAQYKSGFSSWQRVHTEEYEDNGTRYIGGTLFNVDQDQEYFITVYNVQATNSPKTPFPWFLFIIIISSIEEFYS